MVSRLGAVLGVMAAYVVLAQFTFMISQSATPAFFPAAGLTLAALLLAPRRMWPALLLAVFAAEVALDLWHGLALPASLMFGVANTMEPLLTVLLISRFVIGPRITLMSVRDLFAWGTASLLGCGVGAVIGAAGIASLGAPTPPFDLWVSWWTGDVLGQLVVAPFICSFTAVTAAVPAVPRLRATVLAIFAAIVVTVVSVLLQPLALPLVAVALLGWTGLVWGVRGTARLGLTVSTLLTVASATAPGLLGPAELDPVQWHSLTQIFLVVSIAGAMLLAAEVASRQAVETELRRREAQLAHDAGHDALTGLANRALFMTRLTASLDTAWPHRRPALLYCDLDRFKQVNDTLGHDVGDRVLQVAARRLEQAVPVGSTVARLGGDEFVALVEDSDPGATAALAGAVAAALAEPTMIEGHRLSTAGSVGVALADGPDVVAGDLLREADHAMYAAKQSGARRLADPVRGAPGEPVAAASLRG